MRSDETFNRVLDAAENRFRRYGFHGTSFRDLATDVGIKSASVHYHFPTKSDLGLAVTTRYTERFLAGLGPADRPDLSSDAKVEALVAAFRRVAEAEVSMCLCGLFATEKEGLPPEVSNGVSHFFHAVIDWLTTALGGSAHAEAQAIRTVAQLEGALLLAHSLGGIDVFDAATTYIVVE